jgi:hypothetical protein
MRRSHAKAEPVTSSALSLQTPGQNLNSRADDKHCRERVERKRRERAVADSRIQSKRIRGAKTREKDSKQNGQKLLIKGGHRGPEWGVRSRGSTRVFEANENVVYEMS